MPGPLHPPTCPPHPSFRSREKLALIREEVEVAYTREKSHAFDSARNKGRRREGDKACMQMGGRARKERIDIEKVSILFRAPDQ